MYELNTQALKLKNNILFLLDQTKLPHQELWEKIDDTEAMVRAIKQLKVRGAPLIGISAALFFALELSKKEYSHAEAEALYKELRASRPTAVNLMNELDLLWSEFLATKNPQKVLDLAVCRAQKDIATCEKMAEHALPLIAENDRILTHCNSGALATCGRGTALGVITKAHEVGKNISVYVDETRPLLQGARLTAWELKQLKIPHALICDSFAAYLMQQKRIDKIFVGADRITKNGDVANKIGTYSLAVLAHYHKIPFYVVAPKSTFDENLAHGNDIAIEERHADEVLGASGSFGSVLWSVAEKVYNPAFDVTPHHLITGIVTEYGIEKY